MRGSTNKGWSKDGRVWFGVAAFTLSLILILIAIWQWDWLSPDDPKSGSNSDTLRNVGLLIGGVLALVFALWRAWVAERQANASQSQVEASQQQVEAAQRQATTAHQGLLNQRYQHAAELLGNEVLAVRLAGVYALRRLSEEYPEGFHLQCMELLCAFVRNPTKDPNLRLPTQEEWHILGPRIREDVQTAVSFVGQRDLGRVTSDLSDGFKVNLRGANLAGADLSGHCLDGADLTDATLAYANLQDAFFVDTLMTNADLTGARLQRAFFSSSKCTWANFSSAKAQGANFSGACLEGTMWTGARLDGATLTNAKLKGSDLQSAKLTQANVSGAVLGRGRRMAGEPPYETASYEYTRLTQEQLDETVAASEKPPKIDPKTTDMKTGDRLVWSGQSV